MLESRIKPIALELLSSLRKSSGKEIIFDKHEMSNYLSSRNNILSKNDKCLMFAMRNTNIIFIENNFQKTLCNFGCKEENTLMHIYNNCKIINRKDYPQEKFNDFYNGTLNQQINIFFKLKENMEKRKLMIKDNETAS